MVMNPDSHPALSAAEWTGVLSQKDGLAQMRQQFAGLPFSTHAIAALLLYGETFGFTQQDVQDEHEVSEYCAVMAKKHREEGDRATAAKFEMLGGRHHERAEKIAALLPPPGTTPGA
jgi:hypothetical protein